MKHGFSARFSRQKRCFVLTRKGEQGPPPPPGITAAPSCTYVQLCPADVERDAQFQQMCPRETHFHDPRRRLSRRRGRCEVMCTVSSAKFSFPSAGCYHPPEVFPSGRVQRFSRSSASSMTVLLLLFLGISSTGRPGRE